MISSTDDGALSPQWLVLAVKDGVHRMRALPISSPTAVQEEWRERSGGHPVDASHRPHIGAALEWLARAQDKTGEGGFSRGYSLVWNADFAGRGWQPAYPETTGHIITALYQAARYLNLPHLLERAERAARWLVTVQRASGVLRPRAIGRPTSAAVFHTGQVILGWLAAARESRSGLFASAARGGARYLAAALEEDHLWRRGSSRCTDPSDLLFKARAAWALAEAGEQLGAPEFTVASAKALREVVELQSEDGWIPGGTVPGHGSPLLHRLAAALRGMIEAGDLMKDEALIERAVPAARAITGVLSPDGRLPGRLAEGWRAAAPWSCLAGQAEMVSVWLRLFEITGDRKWLRPVPAAVRFLKSTQNRTSRNAGLRGGIKGSVPFGGPYGRYQTLNWATSYFVEALVTHARITTSSAVVHAVASALMR